MSRPKTHTSVAIGLIGLLAFTGIVLLVDLESVRHIFDWAWSQMKSAPAPVYFGIMSILLLAPVPASMLYIAAGPIYGIVPSLLWIAPALAVNAFLVHLIARGWLRPRLEALVSKRTTRIPQLQDRGDQLLFITLIRITPGIPFFIQNWLLGLSGVDRVPFILITVAIQMLYATGFVVLGRSAIEGDAGLATVALALLVVVMIGARFVQKRLRRASRSTIFDPQVQLRVRTIPMTSGPIIPSATAPLPGSPHANVNGPSLLRVPEWVANPLGRYYLYFADHKGDRIRLAYSDALLGPWRLHEPGVLHLRDTPFVQSTPEIPADVDREALAVPRGDGVPSPLDDCTIPHIASPEVVIDEASRSFRLYYHGLDGFMRQVSRVAIGRDGLSFEARAEVLTAPYLRMFRRGEFWYGLTMPGKLYRSRDGLTGFESGPTLFEPDMRHAGLWLREDMLWVFWTRVGDTPERILLSQVDLHGDWTDWRETQAIEVRRPGEDWEGANEPIAPSLRSAVDHPVHQLRDPYFFEDADGERYLVYAVAGESGLAIARLEVDA